MSHPHQNLPEDIGEPASMLTDGDIRQAVEAGYLIPEDYDEQCLRHSSYELRVGEYELSSRSLEKGDGYYWPNRPSDCVTLKPGESAKVWTAERLAIPPNVLGRVTVVGQIFTSGIAAGSTFADPGYRGRLYISLSNITDRVLNLPKGRPLARIEFLKLGKPVDHPHPGQEGTRDQFVVPERAKRLSATDLKEQPVEHWLQVVRTFDETDRYDERHVLLCHVVTTLHRRLLVAERRLDYQLLGMYGLFVVAVAAILGEVWSALPTGTQDAVSKRAVVSIGAGAVIVVGFLVKRLRSSLWALVKRLFGAEQESV